MLRSIYSRKTASIADENSKSLWPSSSGYSYSRHFQLSRGKIQLYRGFPDSSVGKESACQAGDPSLIPGSGRSTREEIGYPLQYSWASLVVQLVKESASNLGDLGLIPGLGRSPGEGKGYPLEYSGPENAMDCIDHGIAKSPTRLSNFHFHTFITPEPAMETSNFDASRGWIRMRRQCFPNWKWWGWVGVGQENSQLCCPTSRQAIEQLEV